MYLLYSCVESDGEEEREDDDDEEDGGSDDDFNSEGSSGGHKRPAAPTKVRDLYCRIITLRGGMLHWAKCLSFVMRPSR